MAGAGETRRGAGGTARARPGLGERCRVAGGRWSPRSAAVGLLSAFGFGACGGGEADMALWWEPCRPFLAERLLLRAACNVRYF